MTVKKLAVALILLFVLILGACADYSAPLTLQVTSSPTGPDEEVTLTLTNPKGNNLFIPADWAGIEFFRRDSQNNWTEYLGNRGIVPMLNTEERELVYSIPAGTLSPGTYKLVIRGRVGHRGTPFTLETNLDYALNDSEGS